MNEELTLYIECLKDIHRHLSNIEYACFGREYRLDEDEMSWIFYCRDYAWTTLKEFEKAGPKCVIHEEK